MDGDTMLEWLVAHRCRDAFGALGLDGAKEIAHYADRWDLTNLNPKQLGDQSFPPRRGSRALPIVVGLAEGVYEVLDGKHRVAEANYAGAPTIQAYVGKFFGDTDPKPAVKTAQVEKPGWFWGVIADAGVGDETYEVDNFLLKTEGWGPDCFEGIEGSDDYFAAEAEAMSPEVISNWQNGHQLPDGQWRMLESAYVRHGASPYGVTWALFEKAL